MQALVGPFTHNPYHHHQHPSARTDFRPRSDTIPSVSSNSSTVEFPQQYAISISSSHEMAMRRPSMRSLSFLYLYTSTNASLHKASSKADVFEAKVASAVDEENSSDSDETFVYESNPPDPPPHKNRHHSRTP